MNHRERFRAVMHRQPNDRIPCVNFGFWNETLDKWIAQGHLTEADRQAYLAQSDALNLVADKMGYDYIFLKNTLLRPKVPTVISTLYPPFEEKMIRQSADGSSIWLNHYGVYEKRLARKSTISAEVDWTLKEREDWEENYKPRYEYTKDRIDWDRLNEIKARDDEREYPLGLFAGSLFGQIRNILGIVNMFYMMVDEPELLDEIIETVFLSCYTTTEGMLKSGIKFEFVHFWEDICYSRGPLISPKYFEEHVGKYYRRMTDMIHSYGIDLVTLDCDGVVDDLVPIWLDNGVNVMFPIEVGTWGGNITDIRKKYGKNVLAIGGVNKKVLTMDKKAIDAEIERIRPMVDEGGFLPCFDHHITPDSEWDLTLYYFEQYRKIFG